MLCLSGNMATVLVAPSTAIVRNSGSSSMYLLSPDNSRDWFSLAVFSHCSEQTGGRRIMICMASMHCAQTQPLLSAIEATQYGRLSGGGGIKRFPRKSRTNGINK